MPNAPTAEMNRFSRYLCRRALDLRFETEDGQTVRDDARRLNAEAAIVKSTALANLTLSQRGCSISNLTVSTAPGPTPTAICSLLARTASRPRCP